MHKQYVPSMVMLFAAVFCCLGWPAPQSTAFSEAGTGLEGEIRIGPIHGGPSRIGVSDSRPLANTAFVVKKEGKIIASFQTDDHGRFRVSVPPGKSTVSKEGAKGRVGSCGPFVAEIIAGQITKVQWECDSGMR